MFHNYLLDMTTKVQTTKAKIKWNYIKLKIFCTEKETIKPGEKAKYRMGKMFANGILDEGLCSKYIKNSYNLI